METFLETDARDDLLMLARSAIHSFVVWGQAPKLSLPLPPSLLRRAAVFVSVKKGGRLRGCVGTIHPVHESLAGEIVSQAIRAVSADPRFDPVRPDELEDLDISVDVLSPPEICGRSDLDPSRYGLIVEHAGRRGLLLPDLPEVKTAREQIAIAREKAGIPPRTPLILSRFTVERHTAHERPSPSSD